MKKKILLGLKGAIFLMLLLVSIANAQIFIASFGVQQNWGVPHRVSHYIDNHYYDYNWVHARRVVHHGNVEFEVILQRRNIYLQVTLDRFGHVYKTVRRDYYPLYDHVCGDHCGFYSNYYFAYNSSFRNHAHNHVNYYRKPKGRAYGNYKNHGNGYNNNHYNKGHKNGHGKGYKSHSNNPSRRGEIQNENNGNGRSYSSRDGYNRQNRNGTTNSNKNGRKPTTTASRRPR